MTVRTRFAPSPTGYLHIGGVRTALFCWLFARRNGGQFILRIDDTDQQRNVEEALAPILHGLHWLGIDWDEGPEIGGPHAPYYQSQRADRYQAAVEKLLAAGAAYYDYATTEELQAEREAASGAGVPPAKNSGAGVPPAKNSGAGVPPAIASAGETPAPLSKAGETPAPLVKAGETPAPRQGSFVYSRRFMAESAADRVRFEAEGRRPVVRLKMPREGTLVIRDIIRGDVAVEWAREQDHVIQRADGTCLYHLASVVDDHDFQITHVIRAEEHLSNTPRQIFIAQSLGYELPIYAHLPFVAEPGSKTKLSKRKLDKYLKNADFAALVKHGRKVADALKMEVDRNTFNPVVVDFYEQVGYLPDAIINYLALLGWALDDQTEHFSRDELIQHFSLERVNKSAASFDPKKLSSFQDWHTQQLPIERKIELVAPYLERAGLCGAGVSPAERVAGGTPAQDFMAGGTPAPLSPAPRERAKIEHVVRAAGDRIKTAGDILDYGYFFVADGKVAYDEKAVAKSLQKPGAAELLVKYAEHLAAAESFEAQPLEQMTHAFVANQGVKIGDIVHALRAAVTGQSVGLGLFDSLAILGKESCLARIERALHGLEAAKL